MLLDLGHTARPRDRARRAEDLRSLLDAMLPSETSEPVAAKDEGDLSRILGIPKSRVASALAIGEELGVFARRLRHVEPRTGEREVAWQVSPLFTGIHKKFEEFAEASSVLCREIAEAAAVRTPMDTKRNAEFNLRIAKTVFGKWSVDILALIYSKRTVGFQQIFRALGPISARILSLKLSEMEQLGLLRRRVLGTKPPRVQYSLTSKGLRTAKLGEPVFLYLRFSEGLLGTGEPESSGRTRSR